MTRMPSKEGNESGGRFMLYDAHVIGRYKIKMLNQIWDVEYISSTDNCRFLFAIEHANCEKERQSQKRGEHTSDNPEWGSSFTWVVRFGDGSSLGSKGRVEQLSMVQEVITPVHVGELYPAIILDDLSECNISPPEGEVRIFVFAEMLRDRELAQKDIGSEIPYWCLTIWWEKSTKKVLATCWIRGPHIIWWCRTLKHYLLFNFKSTRERLSSVMGPWWFIHLYGTRDLTRDIRDVLFVPDRVGAWFNLIRLAPRDWL